MTTGAVPIHEFASNSRGSFRLCKFQIPQCQVPSIPATLSRLAPHCTGSPSRIHVHDRPLVGPCEKPCALALGYAFQTAG